MAKLIPFQGASGFFYAVSFFLFWVTTYLLFEQFDAEVKRVHYVVDNGSAVECITSNEDYRSSATNWAIAAWVLAIVTAGLMGLLGFLYMVLDPQGSFRRWLREGWGFSVSILTVQCVTGALAAIFTWVAYDHWNRLEHVSTNDVCSDRFNKINNWALISAIFNTVAIVILTVLTILYVWAWRSGKFVLFPGAAPLAGNAGYSALQVQGGQYLQPQVAAAAPGGQYGGAHPVSQLQRHETTNAVHYYQPSAAPTVGFQ